MTWSAILLSSVGVWVCEIIFALGINGTEVSGLISMRWIMMLRINAVFFSSQYKWTKKVGLRGCFNDWYNVAFFPSFASWYEQRRDLHHIFLCFTPTSLRCSMGENVNVDAQLRCPAELLWLRAEFTSTSTKLFKAFYRPWASLWRWCRFDPRINLLRFSWLADAEERALNLLRLLIWIEISWAHCAIVNFFFCFCCVGVTLLQASTATPSNLSTFANELYS